MRAIACAAVTPPALFDCVIVGGGPAGLTAAIYLARFHLAVAVIDAGDGRAASIPKTRNHAGFPDGIAGLDLLARMRKQAVMYGAQMITGNATGVDRDKDGFTILTDAEAFRARSVLLATGVVNRRPPLLSDETHADALERGLLRYCPVCDGYEVTDKNIGVFGTGERGVNEALFLRSYSSQVVLIAPEDAHDLNPVQRRQLQDAGIAIVDGGLTRIDVGGATITAEVGGTSISLDSLYPALGSKIRSELGKKLRAKCTDEGCFIVDEHMRTSVAGLFAAGDVVKGLDQISHAMGEGGVAATTIRNDLAELKPQRR